MAIPSNASDTSDPTQHLENALTTDFDFYQNIPVPSTPRIMESNPLEQLKKLLEPYKKEELEALLIGLANSDSKLCNSILEKVKSDKKWCKLFVHSLSYQTTNETLKEFYSRFGNVVEAVVLVDKKGSSKGFGFVTFSNAEEALNGVKVEKKKIDGRVTHCNMAFKGNPKKWASLPNNTGTANPRVTGSLNDRRLFVYSLAWKTDDDSLANSFRNYGELEEAVVIRDKRSGKSKGYGFVTFKYAESARVALTNPEKTIDGRKTHCNFACERDFQIPTGHMYPQPPNFMMNRPEQPMFQPNTPIYPNTATSGGPGLIGGTPQFNPNAPPNLQGNTPIGGPTIPPSNFLIQQRSAGPNNPINLGPSITGVPLSPPIYPGMSPMKPNPSSSMGSFLGPSTNIMLSPQPSHTPNLQPMPGTFLSQGPIGGGSGNSSGIVISTTPTMAGIGIHNPNIHNPNIHNPNIHNPNIHNPNIHNPNAHLNFSTLHPNNINNTHRAMNINSSGNIPTSMVPNTNSNISTNQVSGTNAGTSKTLIAVSQQRNAIGRIDEHGGSSPYSSESEPHSPKSQDLGEDDIGEQ